MEFHSGKNKYTEKEIAEYYASRNDLTNVSITHNGKDLGFGWQLIFYSFTPLQKEKVVEKYDIVFPSPDFIPEINAMILSCIPDHILAIDAFLHKMTVRKYY